MLQKQLSYQKTSHRIAWIIAYLLFVGCSSFAQVVEERSTGRARFKAEHSVIYLPAGVSKLFIDTVDCPSCRANTPAWRFIGELKVDSLERNDTVEVLLQESQMDSIHIYSDSLQDIFFEKKVFVLARRVSFAVPNDTLAFDSIWQKYSVVPDMSKHYYIAFNDQMPVESLSILLAQSEGISNVGGYEEVFPDYICETASPPSPPWTPNDPYGPGVPFQGWHLRERDVTTGQGGINAECAWGLLPDNQRGKNVYVAIIDLGVKTATTHPDLIGKFSSFGELSYFDEDSTHGIMVTGVSVAQGDNGIGVCGVAPEAKFIPYDVTNGTGRVFDIMHANVIATGWKVIQITWRQTKADSGLYEALEWSNALDIPVVVSAGNIDAGEPPWPYYPQIWNDLDLIVVGSHSSQGNWDPRSNYGCPTCDPPVPNFVDIVAPGTTLSTTTFDTSWYCCITGTSASCPVVAGLVALLRSHDGNISHTDIEDELKATANKTSLTPDSTYRYGAGRVDAYQFLRKFVNTNDPTFVNSEEVALDSLNPKLRGREALSVDSVPCMIIADSSMLDELLPLAIKKQKMGTWTGIVLTHWINTAYSGSDMQEKIRNCIKYYHDERNTEYFILAGDSSIIPYRKIHTMLRAPGDMFISDYYYSCLDGDWNFDSDSLWGEVEDSIDLVPDVAVGRLPISTSLQVSNFIDKLNSYERPGDFSWETRLLSLGSQMFAPGDGKRMNEALVDSFPSEFEITELYDDSTGTASLANYFTSMNMGQGIVLKHGLGDQSKYYLVRESEPYAHLFNSNVDTLSNDGMPSVVLSATCFAHKYDLDCMAKHYMNHSTGGAIAYIGTTYNDYVYSSYPVINEFFSQLFGDGPKQIGDLLNLGKETILDKATVDGPDRHIALSYALSGDPHMWIWTDTPKVLSIYCSADSFTVDDSIVRDFYVHVSYDGNSVESSLVCIRGPEPGTPYSLKYTNSSGLAYFSLVFPIEGYASVVASKYNYVYVKDSINIKSTSSCPMLYVWNGSDYRFLNNILAHSEDQLNNDFASEFYPIYNAPIRNGKVNLKILEDENEVSSIRLIKGHRVEYTDDQKLIFTNQNRFRVLSDQFLLPSSASLNGETDVTSLISSQDGDRLVVYEPGFLIVKYLDGNLAPKKGQTAALDEGGGGIGEPPCGNCKGHSKVVSTAEGHEVMKQFLNIYALNENDSWIHVNTVYPRFVDMNELIELQDYFVGPEVTIKLEWTQSINLDYLPYLLFTGEEFPMNEVTTLFAMHNDSGNVVSLLTDSTGGEITLKPGQNVELEFQVSESPDSNNVAFVLQTYGKYEIGGETKQNDGTTAFQNYPNPFNPNTTFSFSLPVTSNVEIVIYNILGQEVKTLVNEEFAAGTHSIEWDSKANNGNQVASGVYFAKFVSKDVTMNRKLMILK